MNIATLFRDVRGLPVADAARAFADAGIAVFPCLPGGKRPLTRRGFQDATASLRRVDAWWRRWPEANISLPTGPSTEHGGVAGFDVVDIDIHPGGSGFGAFGRARRDGLLDGWMALVRSPSGGLHLYYPAHPESPQPSWQAPGAHVDFRGTGGYIIAPPSTIGSEARMVGRYEVIAANPAKARTVDAAALRSFLEPATPATNRPARAGHGADAEQLAAWVAARGEGERNRGLFWAACRLAETGHPLSETHTALAEAAEHAGLPTPEVLATIRSAYRTVAPANAGTPPSMLGPASSGKNARALSAARDRAAL